MQIEKTLSIGRVQQKLTQEHTQTEQKALQVASDIDMVSWCGIIYVVSVGSMFL